MKQPTSPPSSPSMSSPSASSYSDTLGLLNEKTVPWRIPRVRHLAFIVSLICLGFICAELVWWVPLPVKRSRVILNQDIAAWLDRPSQFDKSQDAVDVSVVAVVSFSTRAILSMLDCYLQQNLVSRGGIIDTVLLVPEPGVEDDLDWLELLVYSCPEYKLVDESWQGLAGYDGGINLVWANVEPETLYIHISSEIVFIEPTALASMLETKLKNPEYAIVSANVVNQPTLSWIHHHLGVVQPYRPEMKPLLRPLNASTLPRYDWRASDLPTWRGPEDFEVPADFGIPTDFQPPFTGHRWLPIRTNITSFNPMSHEVLDINGPGKWSWTTGALHHYSFLEHLEQGQLYRYKFPMWDLQAEILSPSMFAMWGKDIMEIGPMPERGQDIWLSKQVPQILGGRSPLVDGRAMAVHFAHGPQAYGMASTDLLTRYNAYALENICR